MILNETQKKEVIKLVTERVTECKEKGRDPMFIAGEIEDCIVWNLNLKFE